MITKATRKRKRYKVRLTVQARLVITFGLMILLSLLLFWIAGWEHHDEEVKEPEAVPACAYSPEGFFLSEDGRIHYEDDTWVSRQVVDVSIYHKEINWQQAASDGIDMAIIRLGYRGYESGYLNLDRYFEQNVAGARAAGLEVGVYFFSQAVTAEEAEEEARFVLQHIRGKKIDGPVCFDMEHIEGAERISHLTVEEKTAAADAFCRLIEKKGYDALIYGNPKWLTEDVNLSLLTDYEIWVAHYAPLPAWDSWYHMWQYTDCGRVAGIEGGVDLNVQMIEKKYLL